MSANSGRTLTVSGHDLAKNGSSNTGAPWEDAGTVLKPTTPTRKPQPVSISAAFSMQHHFEEAKSEGNATKSILYTLQVLEDILVALILYSAVLTDTM